ncbi:M16 family metallopeptidase [Pedobacter mendelii]|uniref:Peptidase M16 n=1 Tax=Pedobacter mendelii TaxID=1908240 RepID=A0ABQ2BGS7_9SPHI|nr:M16 family metallopeptidase [Pedobacter mendelii]GGI25292.1 peptidase M16 [Pedobacter mendelii]
MQIKIFIKGWPFAAILITCALLVSAQNKTKVSPPKNTVKSNSLAKLSLDTAVRTGKLANGFTYFIRRNNSPKNRVTIYLANKVGSILENDDQQGLAHFMEHMNFNGTTHFPKNELVNYLQKAGVRFGADINAYTGFDETVYQLPLPSDKPEILSNGIQIMRDWAKGALLDPGEIDQERGVIIEEKRLGKGAAQRMQQKYFPVLFNNSRYGKRLPIGLDTVLNNFRPETLAQFYNDWYRPNLQALIVVGDINVDEIEKEIKRKFSDLQNPVNQKVRTKYQITPSTNSNFVKVTDPEMTSTQLQVLIKQEAHPLKTAADYRDFMVKNLFNVMLGDRYRELAEAPRPPFLGGGASIGGFVGNLDAFTLRVAANPGELESGFKAVWREIERLKKYGFSVAELDRAKKNSLKLFENNYKQKTTAYSDGYVKEYLDYFLHDNAAPGIEKERLMMLAEMPTIQLADVNKLGLKFISKIHRDIIITAPEKEKTNLPDEATVNNWMKSVQNETLVPYKSDFTDQPLISKQPLPGKIVKTTILKAIEATELTLSNGTKVILKPNKFAANTILVKVFAPGGSSLYSDLEYESANVASYLVSKSGLGNYNYKNLSKYVSSSSVATSVSITDYSQGIQAAASPDDLEILLQMTYLYFTDPKKDPAEFDKYIAQTKASLENRKNNPENVFYDTLNNVLSNNSPRRSPPNLEKLNQINYDRSYEIFKERFADAANFTFTFVGDFDVAKVKPLIEKYIASLPSTYKNEKPKDLGIRPPAGQVTKIIYKGLERKATVRLIFSGDYAYNASNNLAMDAMAEVLQIRLIERLREEESGVYSPSVIVRYSKIPVPRYTLNISFGCAPANVDKLIASAIDEVAKLRNLGPTDTNLSKFKAEEDRMLETQLRKIDFWSNYLTDQILNGENIDEINDHGVIMKNITTESIKDMASKYLSGENLIRVILMPETAKP